MKDYYEKMRIIEFIRSIIKKEKLDPTNKIEFKDLKFIKEKGQGLQPYMKVALALN